MPHELKGADINQNELQLPAWLLAQSLGLGLLRLRRVVHSHFKTAFVFLLFYVEMLTLLCPFRRMKKETHLLTAILSKPDASNDLVVNEISADRILLGVVPGGEDFLAEVEPPGRIAFVCAPLLR